MERLKWNDQLQKQKEASITVEASLVLPIFVFAVLLFLYFFQFLYLQDSIQSSMTEAGKFLVRYGEATGESGPEITKRLLLRQSFYQEMDKESTCLDCVIGGVEGISLLSSRVEEGEAKIEIVATYQVQFPIPFWGEKTSWVTQKVKTRAFVGHGMKQGSGNGAEADAGELNVEDLWVFVTENGTVYHTNEECTHLRLSISGIAKEDVTSARNENGSRYQACDKCVERNHLEETVYITREGECYHNFLSCSGLKRTVYSIPYLEAAGMRKCTRCN